jgi:hypothetical protein
LHVCMCFFILLPWSALVGWARQWACAVVGRSRAGWRCAVLSGVFFYSAWGLS